jgi:ComB9 competence protein
MKFRRLFGATAICLAVVNAPSLSFAQTALQPPGANTPFARGGQQATQQPTASVQERAANQATPGATMPPSEAAVRQAAYQREGLFPPMVRPSGGQIQEGWSDVTDGEGVHTFRVQRDVVYRIITREMMTTTIILPEDAEILSADLGDPSGFRVQVRTKNILAVQPAGWGIDTNLNVYTKNGVYPFYLRAENAQSYNIPDILVRFTGSERGFQAASHLMPTGQPLAPMDDDKKEEGDDHAPPAVQSIAPVSLVDKAVEGLQSPAPKTGDWVREVAFDPARLRGFDDYELWGDDELKPVRVFRDDRFTYVQYGDRWDAAELPTAYVVVDDIDEAVNTRVQGSTYIIEAVAPLISMKIGKKFLCIKYTGEE